MENKYTLTITLSEYVEGDGWIYTQTIHRSSFTKSTWSMLELIDLINDGKDFEDLTRAVECRDVGGIDHMFNAVITDTDGIETWCGKAWESYAARVALGEIE